jgi:hypothetical protein
MDHRVVTTIVYDDDEIRVIWSPGSSDFVLITLGDMITLSDGQRFFADVPVRKLGIAAIGIMAKRISWYPSENLRKAASVILYIIGTYETRMIYGGSMGGYAALKYSRLLGASHVIALCPQWSLDQAECRGKYPGWGEYFTPSMSGMGIRPKDVAGEVFIFADALEKTDMFHCRMIIENCPPAHFINVPHVEHHVTTVFAGTVNLRELIAACRVCDITALHRISRRTRKSHFYWERRIFHHAIRRSPRIVARFLVDAGHDEVLRENWRDFPYIFRHLARTGGARPAIAFYERFWPLLPGPMEQRLVCAYLAEATGARIAIATTHSSWLFYDLCENIVLHDDAPDKPYRIAVEVDILDTGAALFVTVGGTRFLLTVNERGVLEVPRLGHVGEGCFRFGIISDGHGRFTISHGGRYLSAEPGGVVICDRDTVAEWEKFRFAPLFSNG